MGSRSRRIGVALLPVALAVGLAGCGGQQGQVASEAPATVEPVPGTDQSRVRLSAEAVERLGVETAPVRAGGDGVATIPYAAVLYDVDGRTWAYASPEQHLFVRAPIVILSIVGEDARLVSGPPAGTQVVTVGGPELLGIELGVSE